MVSARVRNRWIALFELANHNAGLIIALQILLLWLVNSKNADQRFRTLVSAMDDVLTLLSDDFSDFVNFTKNLEQIFRDEWEAEIIHDDIIHQATDSILILFQNTNEQKNMGQKIFAENASHGN